MMLNLQNPNIILIPITLQEAEKLEKEIFGDENIYILYQLPEQKEIQIAMMSTSMRKYFPETTNTWALNQAEAMSFFYNGGSELEKTASEITDRPVYSISPSDDRTVENYKILNRTLDNNLDISLEDIVTGKHQLNYNTQSVFKKIKKSSKYLLPFL